MLAACGNVEPMSIRRRRPRVREDATVRGSPTETTGQNTYSMSVCDEQRLQDAFMDMNADPVVDLIFVSWIKYSRSSRGSMGQVSLSVKYTAGQNCDL